MLSNDLLYLKNIRNPDARNQRFVCNLDKRQDEIGIVQPYIIAGAQRMELYVQKVTEISDRQGFPAGRGRVRECEGKKLALTLALTLETPINRAFEP